MSAPTVAVVILNWNGRQFLEQFLPSVTASSYQPCTIYVADNASTDDSLDYLKAHWPQVKIISLPENYGFTKGYNEALRQVQADYYVLLNSDVEVEAGWLEPMVRLLESDHTIGACQPRIRSYHQRDHFEYAGAAGGWIDRYGYPFCRGRIFEQLEPDTGQYNDTVPVFWASGAAMFVRASVFHELRGFDTFFFAHQEEIDLCWRMQLAGYSVYVCPDSIVYHVGGGTLPRGNSRKTFLNFRNNHIMLAKNLTWPQRLWIIPFRFCLDGVTAWKQLLSGDSATFKAIVKAHFAFIGWLFNGRKKSNFPIRRDGKLQGVLPANLAWLHFARGKKKFSEIVQKTH